MESVDEQPTYYSGHEAALALSEDLKALDQIEADRGRYMAALPHHVERERDRAVASVRAAIRHLCTEDD